MKPEHERAREEAIERTPGFFHTHEDGQNVVIHCDYLTEDGKHHHYHVATIDGFQEEYRRGNAALFASAPQMRQDLDAHQQAMQGLQAQLDECIKEVDRLKEGLSISTRSVMAENDKLLAEVERLKAENIAEF